MAVALIIPNVFEALIFSYSFWTPTVLAPLAAALVGFRAPIKVFAAAAASGAGVFAVWEYVFSRPFEVNAAPIAFAVNMAVLIFYAKYLKKIKDTD